MTRVLSRNVGVALKAAHGGDAHRGDEVRIFAERLFDASPARIARDVDDGRQRLMRAARRAPPRAVIVKSDSTSSGLNVAREPDRLRRSWCRRARRGRAGIPRGR